jgi:hypothetical protein
LILCPARRDSSKYFVTTVINFSQTTSKIHLGESESESGCGLDVVGCAEQIHHHQQFDIYSSQSYKDHYTYDNAVSTYLD